jgi:hypothetical protein
MGKVYLGLDGKLYRGEAGSTAADEVTNIKDVTLSLEKSEADVTTRGTGSFRAMIGTLKEASLEFEMLVDSDDDDYNAFAAAFFDNTAIALKVEVGTGALDADWSITNFTINQPLEEAQTVSVTAKVTNAGREPQWVTGGAGA